MLSRDELQTMMTEMVSRQLHRQVREFMIANGETVPTSPAVPTEATKKLALDLVTEEYTELAAAVGSGDVVAIAAEIADLMYVTERLAAVYGIHMPPIQVAIHEANMRKFKGTPRYADNGKRLKPEGWQPADISSIVRRQQGK